VVLARGGLVDIRHEPARLLFVEDDVDIRETLADLLRDEGYDVVEVGSAEEGLEQLQAQRFQVLLSDYRLPDKSGTWMIAEARQRGALEHTAALMLSASVHIEGSEGIRVLQKPIDLDDLCREIEQATASLAAPHDEAVQEAEPPAVQLRLFVFGASPSAARARQALENTLRAYRLPAESLTVVDVTTPEGAELATQERIAFTPALLRVTPLPRRWIVGDLRRKAVLERLLRESGVRRG
jgi:CheY-like chemotaxis protein